MKLKKIFLTWVATFFLCSAASSQCQITGNIILYPYSDGCVQTYSIGGNVILNTWNGNTYQACGGAVHVELQKFDGMAWQYVAAVTTTNYIYNIGLAQGSASGVYRVVATNPSNNCSCTTTTPYISASINVNVSVIAPTLVVGQKYDATNSTNILSSTTCSSPFNNICPVYSAPYSYMLTAINSTIPSYQIYAGQWSCKLEEVPVSNCSATPSLVFNKPYATIGSMSNLDNIDLNALAVAAGLPANYINYSKRYKFTLNIKYTCGNVFTYVGWFRYSTGGCRMMNKEEIETDETIDNSISLFPNPVTSILEIKTNNTIQSVILIDITGKEMKTELKDNAIDLSKFGAGIYTIKVYTNDGVSIEKIIKQE